MPREAQLGLILLPLAWIVFVAGQAMMHGTISLVQLGMGGLCCMLVFSHSNWGRWFCGVYNCLLMLSMCWQGFETMERSLVTIATSLVFAGATIALFMPRTGDVFRKANTMVHGQVPSTRKR